MYRIRAHLAEVITGSVSSVNVRTRGSDLLVAKNSAATASPTISICCVS
jgi:hypothetical protein